jgi:hypothetical protein
LCIIGQETADGNHGSEFAPAPLAASFACLSWARLLRDELSAPRGLGPITTLGNRGQRQLHGAGDHLLDSRRAPDHSGIEYVAPPKPSHQSRCIPGPVQAVAGQRPYDNRRPIDPLSYLLEMRLFLQKRHCHVAANLVFRDFSRDPLRRLASSRISSRAVAEQNGRRIYRRNPALHRCTSDMVDDQRRETEIVT